MTAGTPSLQLYRHPLSGHCHRVELFLSLLGLPAELLDVDLLNGEQKGSEYLARNPFGQIPVLVDGEHVVADSNAILVYLALRYDSSRQWYPAVPAAAAEVQRWLSVAAGQLASGPAAARLFTLFKAPLDHERTKAVAGQLFALMDQLLASTPYLAHGWPTVADVALYAYTSHAPEGGISLAPYPNIRAWLARIEALPGFVPMRRSTVAAAA